VGEEGEYTLGKSFTEGNGSFGGQTARLPEVAVAMEREWEREERKEERKKEGLAEPLFTKGRQPCWHPTVTQGRQRGWHPPIHCGAAPGATVTIGCQLC
jgi:hypothetical protein